MAYFGRFGTRGAGYTVPTLQRELKRILSLTRPWSAAIVGVGRLGQAIAHYLILMTMSLSLKACFDIDESKISQEIAGLKVHHLNDLPRLVREKGIDIGFITVPQNAAQTAADALVAAGIKGILNFAPTVIEVPNDIHVENVDFLAGLKRLSFYILNPHLKEELTL
ncbi:MAG: redox-sensing transcriptional repressor Rex [Deinococcales bacterium]